MADVIDVDENRETTEHQPERRVDCECVFFNQTDKTIVVNQVGFNWDGPQPLLSSKHEVAAGKALRCDNGFYYHASKSHKTYWTLDVKIDGNGYKNEKLEVDLWERDGGQTVTARLYKMQLFVDPPKSESRSKPMKKQ